MMTRRLLSLNLNIFSPARLYSDLPSLKSNNKTHLTSSIYSNLKIRYWNEKFALKKQQKDHRALATIKSTSDFLIFLQSFSDFPTTFRDLLYFIRNRLYRRDLINQTYLRERELVLKPDLAVAHFIVSRGGSVKFFGQSYWIGYKAEKNTLPLAYVPGFHIEAINAEGTGLSFVGIKNLRNLKLLNSLSLKNLQNIDDWCLDWITKEFYSSLKHLDISYCQNVTYRGLSCFYRFECLKTLNMEGIPDTQELKLACLMLLDIMPNLDIQGIDLDLPDKIDPVKSEQCLSEGSKHISKGRKIIF